jgi:hypothetical protein
VSVLLQVVWTEIVPECSTIAANAAGALIPASNMTQVSAALQTWRISIHDKASQASD